MKTWILRASAAAFAAGLMGSLACGGSAMSCGGTNINAVGGPASAPISMQCGPGTYLSHNECIPSPPPAGGGTTPSATPSSTPGVPIHTK